MALVVTVFNEAHSIGQLLESVLAGSVVPGEFVLVDGGSSDGTVAVAESYVPRFSALGSRFVVVVAAGAGIAEGRNIGIARSSDKFVAITDGGCTLDPSWYERITAPLAADEADVVGGFFVPLSRSSFERAVAAVTTTDRPPRGFVPSSRSFAFNKSLWEAVGRYPEHLRWGEDTEFALRCIRQGRYVVVPDAVVRWRVRSTLSQLVRQFHQYGRGDGRAGATRASVVSNQVVYWTALGLAFSGKLVAAALIFVTYPVLLTSRKARRVGVLELPFAICLVAIIQCARFTGYVRGTVERMRVRVRS